MKVLKTKSLVKEYGKGNTAVRALKGVDIEIESGEFVAIMGPSGCGKSTLLHLLGALHSLTEGDIELDGQSLSTMNEEDLTVVRRQKIGFIFQFFNLIPVLNVVENVALPLVLDGMKQKEANKKAKEWLKKVGLGDRDSHYPSELSGGQQQRVAIARALCHDPKFILADEPTGNLDQASAREVASLLKEISETYGKTIVMVTHDNNMASYANRVIHLVDGLIAGDQTVA